MLKTESYIQSMNNSMMGMFADALKISLKNPPMAGFIIKTIARQKKAFRLRQKWENENIHVPPFMIASITKRCNLKCKGCYAHAQNRLQEDEMSDEKLRSTISEARELGISIILLAGGEPLIREDIIDITSEFPEIIFPIFTNGMLVNDEIITKFKKQKNIVPVISLEGYEEDTDGRRGAGVYEYLQFIIEKISGSGIFFGTSLTVTRSNFSTITSENYVQNLINMGCKTFFFVEYVPVREGTEDWVLTDEQKINLLQIMNDFRIKYPGLFIAFPGDEEAFGGCLAGGRGFIHISPGGNVEPCPFAPYSDANLQNLSLKESLQSEFLKTIRQNHTELTETKGGCALWEKRDWVKSLIKE